MENEKTEVVEEEISFMVEPKRSKIKNDVVVELALFFILGFLLGITVKTEAVKKITIGFNDYKLAKSAQGYDVQGMQKAILKQAQDQQAQQQVQGEAQPQ